MHDKSRKQAVGLSLLVLLMLLCVAPLVGAADKPEAVASTWVIWFKPGHDADFEAAIKAHAAWRKQAGDPMRWRMYTPVVGEDLDYIVIRSEGHQWADFDAEESWGRKADSGKAFNDQVGAHVAKVAHYFGADDKENSFWTDNKNYRYYGVSRVRFRPGAESDFFDAIKTVVAGAKAGKYPRSWSIDRLIGGSNDINVVWPYTSYADMKRVEPSFAEILATHLGSAAESKALLNRLGAAIESSTYTVYVARPDLSTSE